MDFCLDDRRFRMFLAFSPFGFFCISSASEGAEFHGVLKGRVFCIMR